MELKTYWPIMNNKTNFSIDVVSALLNRAEDEEVTIFEVERILDKIRKKLNDERKCFKYNHYNLYHYVIYS